MAMSVEHLSVYHSMQCLTSAKYYICGKLLSSFKKFNVFEVQTVMKGSLTTDFCILENVTFTESPKIDTQENLLNHSIYSILLKVSVFCPFRWCES